MQNLQQISRIFTDSAEPGFEQETGFEQKPTKVRKEFLISAEPDFEQEVTELTENGLYRAAPT